MFWGLSSLPPEQQEKFLKNWNEMQKKGAENLKNQKMKEEKKRKEQEEEDRILKFVRENPPNPTSFKDMFVYGKIYEKYGDKIFSKKDKAVNTEPVEEEQAKGWFGF